MAKQTQAAPKTFDLEAVAVQVDTLATQATEAGESVLAKKLGSAAKSARHAAKQRTGKVAKKVGTLVKSLQSQGLTPEQIIAKLTADAATE